MAIDPSTLSDTEAQRVLVEFYELLPDAAKPGFDELDSLLTDLREQAPGTLSGPLERLGDDPALRGALARQVLGTLAREPALAPLLERAQAAARQAHMAALPELIAGVLLVLAVLPSHFEKDGKGGLKIQWNHLQNLAALMQPVAEVVKALPKSLLDKLG